MSETVPTWYRDQWAQNVILRFQNRGYVFRGATSPPVKIDGNKFYYLRTGSIEAQPYTRTDEINPLNPNDDLVQMQSSEWDAAVAIYDFDVTRLPVSEVDARQQQCVAALGRRSDRIVYDAVMAAPLPASQVFGSYTTPFDPYLLKQGLAQLIENDVDDDEIYAPLPTIAYEQCETYQIFANSQWAGPDLPNIKKRKGRTFDIANCFLLPPHLRKAYTTGTNLRFRIWSKSAIGSGHNRDVRNEWWREGSKKRWMTNHTIDGVAVPLQVEGIIEFQMKWDPAAISREVVQTHAV